MQRVVIGLSGGVDSSVAAHLLKQQGYDVVALFMINWHDTTGLLEGDCPATDDEIFAELVARKLDIPFHVVDLSEQYRQRVVDYMFAEYEKGRTPNPDVLCNREIKFDIFLKEALKHGADFVATGHYCQKETIEEDGQQVHRLLAGADNNKDQSYFLCQLTQDQLSKALFPIGHLQKPEVRELARELNLASAEKKDSQGICFVGKVYLPDFLQQKLVAKKGQIIEIAKDAPTWEQKVVSEELDLDEQLWRMSTPYYLLPQDGQVVGHHNGAHFFTVGQRKGLNVGGKAEPLFVIKTDIHRNIIYTGQGHDHPGLNRQGLLIKTSEVHWVREDIRMEIGEQRNYMVRIRYRQPLQQATLYMREKGLFIIFKEKQRGIAAGQFAVWYQHNELVGSGVINM